MKDKATFAKNVGARVSSARKSAGLKQSDVVEALEGYGVFIDSSALSKIENGHRHVGAFEIAALAQIIKVSPSALINTPGATVQEEYRSGYLDAIARTRLALDCAVRDLP